MFYQLDRYTIAVLNYQCCLKWKATWFGQAALAHVATPLLCTLSGLFSPGLHAVRAKEKEGMVLQGLVEIQLDF